MNEELQKYYEYLKSAKADVPETYESFASTLSDEGSARKYYDYLKANKFDAPDNYESFSSTLGLKKKDIPIPTLSSISQEPSKESSTAKPPLQSAPKYKEPEPKAKPLDVTDTYTRDLTVSSLLEAQKANPVYKEQQASSIEERYTTEVEQSVKSEYDKYKKAVKEEEDPKKAEELYNSFLEKKDSIVNSLAEKANKEIDSLNTDEDNYLYIEKGDVSNLQKQVQEVLSKPLPHAAKLQAISDIENTFMGKVISVAPEYSDQVRAEVKDVIAKNSLVANGKPTVFGWKQEAAMKKKQLDDAVNKARVEYAKKWPNAPAPIMDETGRMHVTGPSKADYEKLVALENMQWFADRAFNKTLSLPDDEGNFLQGIGSVRDELLTAGISGLVNTAVLGDALRRQKKGEDLSASDQALIDASGILQATTDMYGKAFKRGQGFGESVAWMEGFVLSGGAAKAGEATAMKVLSKATQDRLKKTFMGKVATNVLKGAGSAVARTPLLVGGYDTAIERATGAPMLTEDGTWKVDPASIEPAWKAVAKGVGTNFTEAFGEMGGGFFAGSGIAKKIAQKVGLDGVVIPKWVRKYAETTALQPLGELPEEYFTTLMQTPILGDQSLKEAFSKENNIETAIQVGIMTGVMGFPAVVGITAETAQRSRDKGLIDIFGRENITAIRDGIMTNNMMMVNSALNSAMSGKTAEDLKGKSAETAIRQLYNYAYSIAKERGATVAQEEIGTQQVKTNTGTLTTQVGPLKMPIVQEPLEVNGQKFNTKEELFGYLNENAINKETGGIKEGWMDTKELPSTETLRAINEWEAPIKEAAKIKNAKQNATEGAPKVVTGIKDLKQVASYDCGVCSLRTVLAKYGIEETEESLIDQTKPSKENGVDLSSIVETAQSKGLDAEMKQDMTPADIKKSIDQDVPVIVLQNGIGETEEGKDYTGNDDAHYIVIKGYDKDGFIFEDPASKKGDLRMSEQELQDRWHGFLDDGKTVANGVGIVISKPGEAVQKTETFTAPEQAPKVEQAPTSLKTKDDISAYASIKAEEKPEEKGRWDKMSAITGRVMDVLSKIAPDTEIVMLENDEAVNTELTKLGEDPGDFYNGWYHQGKIYLNAARFEESTPIHEAIHPIGNVLRQLNPDKFSKWAKEAGKTKILVDGKKTTYFDYLNATGQAQEITEDEAVVTFLEDFIGGKIDYDKVNKTSVVEAVKQMLTDLLTYFGIDPKTLLGADISLDNIDDLTELSKALLKAFEEGRAVTTAKTGVSPKVGPIEAGGVQFLNGTAADYPITEGVQGASQKSIALPDGRKVGGMNMPEVVNGFYSPIEKRLLDFKQEKASINKWKEIIGKGDEATFTGVSQWLSQLKPDQTLTKAEISQFMKDNRIEVVEVVKGEPSEEAISTFMNDEAGLGFTHDEAREYLINDESENPTEFHQYQLPGEKENYKEVLVTLPRKKTPIEQKASKELDQLFSIPSSERTEEQRSRILALLDEIQAQSTSVFKSSHFDEPNILVHLRMNTRTDADGKKVLFLEEIQSDWGQKGKKEGFGKQEKFDKSKVPIEVKYFSGVGWDIIDTDTGNVISETPYKSEQEAWDYVQKQWEKSQPTAKGIPSAPFVTDTNAWVKLGLKTALREAIKQGVDRIAWTTGEQQNERYDLSKQVDYISYTKQADGTYMLEAKKEGYDILNIGRVEEKNLEDYVGKEVAKQIVEKSQTRQYGLIDGENLKVGGKGMIGFYGSPQESKLGIVGNIAKSLFKQEPKTTNIETDVSVADKARFDELHDRLDGLSEEEYSEYEALEEKVENPKSKTIQHSIDITPALKEEVKRGLPQFQKAMPGKVLVPKSWDIDEDGKNFIFYHYGNIKGDAIDPKFHGKQAYTSDKRTNKVSYYYVKEGQRERMVGGKPYVVTVPKTEVYPFNEDPLHFYEKVKAQWEKENPGMAFGPVQQIDAMNPMIAKAGYDMVVAKWDAFPLRAESTKPLKFDKKRTEEFGKRQEGGKLGEIKDQMANDISGKASRNPDLSVFYSGGIDAVLADPKLRKLVDKKLLAQYEAVAPQKKVQPSIDKSVTRTPAFKEWFGDSYVLNEDDEPLVVYHGSTKRGIKSFKEGLSFFSPDIKAAKRYGGVIYPVYLRIENPTIIDYEGKEDNEMNAFDIQESIDAGHDGFIAKNVDDGYGISDQYVVYSPNQIKSATENTGAFSKTDSRIQASKVAIDRKAIIANTTEEVTRLKALPKEAEDGATLNLDGTKYTGGGLATPITSRNISQAELTPEAIADFIETNNGKLSDIAKPGLYKFPNEAKLSIDLNIVIPKKYKNVAIEFGRLAGQKSLFDLDTYEYIETGATGENPIQFTDEQFQEIGESLSKGKLPEAVSSIKALESGVSANLGDPTTISKIQPSKARKVVTKSEYPLSFVKKSDLIDIVSMVNEISSKGQKVWFWVADQLGRGYYYDTVLNKEHYLDAGPSYALDPENKDRRVIWATGQGLPWIDTRIANSDYIFIISGSPAGSHAFNKNVFDLFKEHVEQRGDFAKFKKDVLKVSNVSSLNTILKSHDSFDSFKESNDRKELLNILGDQSAKKTPLKAVLDKYNAIINLDDLRDGFYKDNNFKQNDIMLVLKPTESKEGSLHSTYLNDVLGDVVGVPDKVINSYDLLPEEYRLVLTEARAIQSQIIAPYGAGIKEITSERLQPQKAGQGKRVILEEEAPAGEEREKGLYKRLMESSVISKAFKEEIEAQGLTYKVLNNEVTRDNIDYTIAQLGMEEAWKQTKDKGSALNGATRSGLAERLIVHYDRLATDADKAGSPEEAKEYRDKALEIADWKDEYGRDAGRFNQYSGSDESTKLLSPQTTIIRAKRDIKKQRDKQIEKNKEDIKEKRDALRKANKDTLEELLGSDAYQKIKAKLDEAKKKTKRNAPEVIKAKIKREQTYRATQWDLFKKAGGGTLSSTVAGLTKEQIEAIGNIVASYVREGVYRTEDLVRRLQEDWFTYTGEKLDAKEAEKLIPSKIITQAVKEKIKELGIDVNKIVRQHYTVQDATGRTLADKLAEEAGLTPKEAETFAKAIQNEFNRIATEKKRKILLTGITARAKRLTNPKVAKKEWERLVELTNLGAFSNAEFSEAYADIWGFPKLTEENLKEMDRLARDIQTKEGFKKDEAVRDYLNYMANLPGLDLGEVAMGWWYASILSGERTQFKNFLGNLINTVFEASIGTLYNITKGDFKTAQAMWAGLLSAPTIAEAMTEARYTWTSGYSPVRNNKIEAAQYLERYKLKGGWWNPVNYAKYVGRFMSATDVFFYVGLKEMRAHELAMREARKQNAEATEPTASDWAKAAEILYGTKQRKAEAELQAQDEGLTGLAYKKRVWELMEASRGEEMITETNSFASRGTYNYRPEGGLGMITEAIGHTVGDTQVNIKNPFSGKKYTVRFGKFFVPFTRIIANVGNTALDYTPIGAVRAGTGAIGTERKPAYYRKLTSEERARTLIKSVVGVSAATILWLLSEPPDDDDKEPVIQITANGTGDYAKNQELKNSPNGWQQYSIKMGEKWYSYQYTPLFLMLAPLGFVRDTEAYKKDKTTTMSAWNMLTAGSTMFLSALSDMTALSTTSGLLEAISSGDLREAEKFWKRMASSTVKGFAYPKAVEQTKQMIDDFNNNPLHYSSSLAGKMIKDIPVIQNRFPIQYNALGEEVSFDAVQMMEKSTGTPLTKFIVDNGAFIGTPSQKDKFCIIYDDKLGIERGMNDEEYMKFVQVSGTEIKNRIITELMPRTDLEPEQIRNEVNNIKSEVRKQVKATLFGWLDIKKDHPQDWNTMVSVNAVPIPESLVEIEIGDKKTRLDKAQTEEFNKKAVEYYRQYVIDYLRDKEVVKADQDIDPETGDSYFRGYIRDYWAEAKETAKADMMDEMIKNK